MRVLRLKSPRMEGADVKAWQTFLKGRGLFDGEIDGKFGAPLERASIAYQASAGLEDDGVVGDRSYVVAHQDGFAVPGEKTVTGMDASMSCKSFAKCIADAKMSFVARYYADASSKTLKVDEARALVTKGLKLVAVYQDFNDKIERFSAAEGKRQATNALRHAARIGQPKDTAIYFSVDMDPKPAETGGPILDYFKAVNEVLAAAAVRYFPGVYGSGFVCGAMRDAGLAKFTWLCGSTSYLGSRAFREEADIVQVLSVMKPPPAPARPRAERNICGGLQIDDDIAPDLDKIGSFTI